MQVQNVECQLAQAQLRRYLSGETLPEDLVADLQEHLRTCADCAKAAEAQKAFLSQIAGGKAAVDVPTKSGIRGILTGVIGRFIKPKAEGEAAQSKRSRTVILTSALAIVLILMSTVFRNPFRLLGPKAMKPAAAAAGKTQDGKTEGSDKTTTSAAESAVSAASEATEDPLKGVENTSKLKSSAGTVSQVAMAAAAKAAGEAQAPLEAPQKGSTEAKPGEHASKPIATNKGRSDVVIPENPAPGSKVYVAVKGRAGNSGNTTKSHRPVRGKKGTHRRPKHRGSNGTAGGIRVYDAKGNPVRIR